MTRAELLRLAARVEAAPVEMQGVILLQVLDALRLPDRPMHYRIVRMIEVGAYLDAAASLVPEGWGYWIDGSAPELGITVSVMPINPADRRDKRGDADTPALALTAAALRARAEEADD
jgi:hypothetical protein